MPMQLSAERQEICDYAMTLVDTPYHDQGRHPGMAMDCAGVLICTGRHTKRVPPEFDITGYSPHPDGVSMIKWLREYMGPEVGEGELQPGDAVVVSFDLHPQHLAICVPHPYWTPENKALGIVHADSSRDRRRVMFHRMVFNEHMRFVTGFKFPGVE